MFFKNGKRESLLLSSRYYKNNETDLDDYSARVFLIFVIPKDGISTTPPVAIVWFFFYCFCRAHESLFVDASRCCRAQPDL